MNPSVLARFPVRACASIAMSTVSLAAFAYRSWPGHYGIRDYIAPDSLEWYFLGMAPIAVVCGTLLGTSLAIWAPQSEPRVPARIAALLACAPWLLGLAAVLHSLL